MIREKLIQQGKLSDGKSFRVSDGDFFNPTEHNIKISVGDRIICLKNDKRVGVRNGSHGKILNIDEFGKITFQTDSGDIITFDSNSYNSFDLGYAMTINKLQGSTVQKIICNADSNSHFNRNKFYVTVSRAKLDATILTDNKQKLQEDAQAWCHKVTSDDFINDLERQIHENTFRVLHSNYQSKFQRALALQQKFNSPELIHQRNFLRDNFGEVTLNNVSTPPALFAKPDFSANNSESQPSNNFSR